MAILGGVNRLQQFWRETRRAEFAAASASSVVAVVILLAGGGRAAYAPFGAALAFTLQGLVAVRKDRAAEREGLDEVRRLLLMVELNAESFGDWRPSPELAASIYNAIVYQHRLRGDREGLALSRQLLNRPDLADEAVRAVIDEIGQKLGQSAPPDRSITPTG